MKKRQAEVMREQVRLWLDDVRAPWNHGRIGWYWAKSFDDAVEMFEQYDVIEASLDHDLCVEGTLGYTPKEKTGYDLVCWMEARGIYPRDGVHVHSMNPSGAERMRKALAAMRRRVNPPHDAVTPSPSS